MVENVTQPQRPVLLNTEDQRVWNNDMPPDFCNLQNRKKDIPFSIDWKEMSSVMCMENVSTSSSSIEFQIYLVSFRGFIPAKPRVWVRSFTAFLHN
jgi:hypothetical protein